MSEICIVIPGIGGSTLKKNGHTVWDVSDRFFFDQLLRRGAAFEHLSLEHPATDDGVRATGLIKGAMLIPGVWNYGDYRPLTRRMEQHFGQTNVFGFPYDWRQSNQQSASLLRQFIDNQLRNRPRGTKVVLVGHSMGGLIARRYIACEDGYDHTSLVVTIGTPYSGAANAVEAISSGIPKIAGRAGERLHRVLRTLPSVHELLPTYDCVANADGTFAPLATALPESIESTGLCMPAIAFHLSTLRATIRLGPKHPPVLAVCGQQQPTRTFVDLRDGVARVLDDDSWTKPASARRGRGDGTVPRGAAQPVEWGDDVTRAHIVGGSHVDLPTDRRAQQAILAAIQGRQFMGLGSEGSLSLRVPNLISEDEELLVEVRHDDDRLALDLRIFPVDSTVATSHTEMKNLGDGAYEIRIKGFEPGSYLVRVEGFADGEPRTVSAYTTVLPNGIE